MRGMTLTQWGAFTVTSDGREITSVEPLPHDPDPSPIARSVRAVTRSRVMRPSVRRGWLENGPGGGGRGREPFVEVDPELRAAIEARAEAEHTTTSEIIR